MNFIRLSLRSARDLLAMAATDMPHGCATEDLRRAIAEASRVSTKRTRSRSSSRTEKREKRATKNEETSGIRGEVFTRATPDGWSHALCEVCGNREATDLQHVFGRRGERQKVATCLAVCRRCHKLLTNPDDAEWRWRVQAEAFERLGLTESAERARDMEAKAAAKNSLPFVPGVSR